MELDELLGQVDVCFVIDTTSSMAPFIQEARKEARRQAVEVAERGDLDLRFAVVEYRDHPPQESTFVTKVYPFTNSDGFQKVLDQLQPWGGGDRDEAVYDGLTDAGMKLSWRPQSEKLCFLIGDSPPHNPCLCKATPGGVVEVLGSQQIKLHAFSIAALKETTVAFQELTDALSGKTREGEAVESTDFAMATMSASSDLVARARTYTDSVSRLRSTAGGMSASPDTVAADLGWTKEMVEGTSAYLTSRGIADPLSIPYERPDPKPKRTRRKKT